MYKLCVLIHSIHTGKVRITCQTLYSLRPAEPHVLAYAQQNPLITLHCDLMQFGKCSFSHAGPHRGTLFLQTYVQFQTAVV